MSEPAVENICETHLELAGEFVLSEQKLLWPSAERPSPVPHRTPALLCYSATETGTSVEETSDKQNHLVHTRLKSTYSLGLFTMRLSPILNHAFKLRWWIILYFFLRVINLCSEAELAVRL